MEQIGRFSIQKRLGGGGFGEVFLGIDPAIKREVAIKVFKPRDENMIAAATSSDTEGLDVLRNRFVNEAQILAGLEDAPNVVNVLEFGELEDGSPFYVMPYLPTSLSDLIGKDVFDTRALEELPESERPRSLPLDQALTILEQLIEGLAAAHAQGLVHRDIKPGNIMLTDKGDVRLVDFGIAKAPDSGNSTVSQLGMGSRNYMAPEQKESAKHVDASADVYAVGVVAYRMITGRLPMGKFADANVIVPELHQTLSDLIDQCLQVDHASRPGDGTMLLQAYTAAVQQQGAVDEATGTWIAQTDSSLRDELKPLKAEIEKLLLEQGEVPADAMETLLALAQIADLDQQGLESLIDTVEREHEQAIRPIKNFLQLVDQQIVADKVNQIVLLKAGAAIGWDEARTTSMISARGGNGKVNQPGSGDGGMAEPGERTTKTGRRVGPAVVMAIALTLVGGAGWWFWQQQQVAEEQQRLASLEAAAWAKAERSNSLAGYEAYLAQAHTSTEHINAANNQIDALKKAAAAKAEREQREREAWAKALQADTVEGYRSYQALDVAINPRKQEATRRIEELLAGPRPGQTFKDCDVCPEMVVIPAGSFQMGSNKGDSDEEPVHRVTIGKPFALGKTEVTFADYDAYARSSGKTLPDDEGWGRGTRPVINVSWEDASAYAKWLSTRTGKSYRLPSEAEWEYAARAGSTTKYSWGDSPSGGHANGDEANGWPDDGYRKQTAPTGSYQANQFGLHDMHGNVWEWVQDCYNSNYSGAPTEGQAWVTRDCNRRVLRGGSWFHKPATLRSATRFWFPPSLRGGNFYGFRLAQDI